LLSCYGSKHVQTWLKSLQGSAVTQTVLCGLIIYPSGAFRIAYIICQKL